MERYILHCEDPQDMVYTNRGYDHNGISQETLFKVFLFLNRRVEETLKNLSADTRAEYKYKEAKKNLENLIALFS